MKRALAFMLAGSMVLQVLPGCSLTVGAYETEVVLDADGTAMTDSGLEIDTQESFAGNGFWDGSGTDGAETASVSADETVSGDTLVLDEIITVDDAADDGTFPENGETPGVAPEVGTGEGDRYEPESGLGEGNGYEPESEIAEENGQEPETGADEETGVRIEAESEFEPESELPLSDLAGGIQTLSLDEQTGSYIEVKVVATLPFLDSEEVTISLAPETAVDGTSNFQPRTVMIAVPNGAGEKIAAASEKFSVVPGSYTVTVRAAQFADYTQVVQVGAHETARIEVCTSKVKNEQGQSGWLRLGDVDGDHAVTDADVTALTAALHEGLNDPQLDLNANGMVDLADLQFAVQNLNESQEAVVTRLAVPHRVEHDVRTNIDGMENLLYDNGKATLSPADGKAISSENPVSVAFDFGTTAAGDEGQAGTELPELGGMTMQAPVERNETTGELTSDITGGSVFVESMKDGKPVVYEIPLLRGAQEGKAETVSAPAEIISPEESAVSAEIISPDEDAAPAEIVPSEENAGATENAEQEEVASIMLMTVGLPFDAISADEGVEDAISVDEAAGNVIPGNAGAENAASGDVISEDVLSGKTSSADTVSDNTVSGDETVTDTVSGDAVSVDTVEVIDEAEVPEEIAAIDGQDITDNLTAPVAEESGETGKASAEELKADEILSPATLEMDGSFVLDFGGKIAVKRITIRITGTKQTQALAEIAKVQFVNNMEDRIPAPNLNIPEITKIESKNEELVVHWSEQTNVTGYEIEISGPVKKAEDQTQIVRVAGTPHTVSAINDKPLINYKDYKIRIRSVNGEWSSPWTAEQIVQPKPEKGPDRVDNVVAKGGFRSVQVSWKDMDDANGYMLFYREKGTTAYTPVIVGYEGGLIKDGTDRLTQNSYTITGLNDMTTYQVYVVAWNDFDHGAWGNNEPGTDAGPRVAEATTESGDTPRLPKYHLINTYGGSYDDKAEGVVGKLTDHIVSAVCGTHNGQKMVESMLDQEKEQESGSVYPTVNGKTRQYARWALGTVDNSYASYWTKNDWDDGVSYPVSDFSKGITVTFDKPYQMNYLTFTAADLQGNVETAQIVYWKDQAEIDADAAGEAVGCSVVRNQDETNRPYYVVKFDEKITAQQLHLYIGTTYSRIDLKIAEIHFHSYDENVDDAVEALFGDPEHSMLSEKLADLAATDKAAALAEIDKVQAIVETKDPATGEYHPLKDFLLLDLEGARELVNLQLDEPFYVDNTITAAKDKHLNFGGLNAWQPLGRVAAAGEKLVVYVGHNAKSIRQTANLQLICTQYHAESNALAKYYTLKVGKNEITIPEVTSTGGKERGGQLYVAYTGNNAKDQYVVRINGGAKIPVLNVYNKSDAEKKAAISAYIAELGDYVAKIESEHARLHYNETEAEKKDKNGVNNSYVYFPYNERNCFLNATDLMMDHMMYSVPATQIWAALSDRQDKAAAVENALDAIEKTMTLFYQHKGLLKGAGGGRETPAQHLNIRYMQMFSGAFMYASGNHIGVEFPETKLAMAGSWDGFGWGVAHEIGHDINDPNYAIAEITNNYFAQLLTKAANADHATRFKYEDVYEKVTSGAIGRSPNGAVQLALYWQLHLAFDDYTEDANGYHDDRYLFKDYQTMFDNLFFARVDTYSRNPGSAPKNGNKDQAVELKLVKDIDQNLMRLACAAAQENMLPFFERWGMVPDEDTTAFANQYGAPTEKAYYYVNDDARNYRADHRDEEESLKITDARASVELDGEKTNENRVVLKLGTDADETRKGAILGYELVRSTYWRGRKQDAEVIGFTLADENGEATYTDVIAAMDNRVLYYEARAVDKFLNYSQSSDTVSARVSTGGALGKNLWSVETTITAAEGQDKELKGDDYPDGGFDADSKPAIEYGISKVIDGLAGDEEVGPFLGTAAADDRIIIDMQKPMVVTSVKYTGGALGPVTISVSSDKSNWVTVKENYEFTGTGTDCRAQTIWFDAVQADHKKHWIGTYDARYVRFVIHNAGAVEIDEIDICGPSGDDVSFYGDVAKTVGIVKETCTYANENGEALTIPAGALVFTGSYKGNPAYNMVMLYDDAVAVTEDGDVRHGNVVGADLETGEVYAEQIILADVPANGNLGETSDGSWIYFVTPPDQADWSDEAKVRAHSKTVYEGILKEGNGKVRAELYRVDNALTLEGERIVSDTAFLALPESFDGLGEITLDLRVPEQNQ